MTEETTDTTMLVVTPQLQALTGGEAGFAAVEIENRRRKSRDQQESGAAEASSSQRDRHSRRQCASGGEDSMAG